eukprot:gene1574-3443_t
MDAPKPESPVKALFQSPAKKQKVGAAKPEPPAAAEPEPPAAAQPEPSAKMQKGEQLTLDAFGAAPGIKTVFKSDEERALQFAAQGKGKKEAAQKKTYLSLKDRFDEQGCARSHSAPESATRKVRDMFDADGKPKTGAGRVSPPPTAGRPSVAGVDFEKEVYALAKAIRGWNCWNWVDRAATTGHRKAPAALATLSDAFLIMCDGFRREHDAIALDPGELQMTMDQTFAQLMATKVALGTAPCTAVPPTASVPANEQWPRRAPTRSRSLER